MMHSESSHPENSAKFKCLHLRRIGNCHITLDPRLPFPDSVGGIFPGPPSSTRKFVHFHILKLLFPVHLVWRYKGRYTDKTLVKKVYASERSERA